MKFKVFLCWIAAYCLLYSMPAFAGPESDPQKAAGGAPPAETQGPSAVAVSDKFEFGNAVEGTELTHDFVIQNKGAGALNIENVKTG